VKKKARRKREKVERHRVVETPRERQVRLEMERRDRQVQSFLDREHRQRLRTMRGKGFEVPEAGELMHELGHRFHDAAAASAALGESFGVTAAPTAPRPSRCAGWSAPGTSCRRLGPSSGTRHRCNGPVPIDLIIDEATDVPDGELWMFPEPKSSRVFVDGKEIDGHGHGLEARAPDAGGGFEQSDYQREFYSRYLGIGAHEVPRGDQGHHVAPESTRRLGLVASDVERILALQRAGLTREAIAAIFDIPLADVQSGTLPVLGGGGLDLAAIQAALDDASLVAPGGRAPIRGTLWGPRENRHLVLDGRQQLRTSQAMTRPSCRFHRSVT
jgi:hypothetical protein